MLAKSKIEYAAVSSLALIMTIRMLGLFMILPVFSVHAGEFAQATPQLIGLALGIYGLTQGVLQMPFGMISDRIGRKITIAIGLGIFLIGSVYAALAHDIYNLIIGRALQGGGAIGSVVLAMVADCTQDANRSKAMGLIGLAVGISFALAMILGPILDAWGGLSLIFFVTAALALVGLLLLWTVVPKQIRIKAPIERVPFMQLLKNKQLLRLDASIFILHAILTSIFIVIPVILTHTFHLAAQSQMLFYLLVLTCSFLLMLPLLIIAEKKHQVKSLFLAAIIVLGLSLLGLWAYHLQLWWVGVLLLIFFVAFSLLEAVLPSWVSKLTPVHHKGAVMGVYSTSQFLGIFTGGILGGWVFAHFSVMGVFALGAGLSLLWLSIALFLQPAPHIISKSQLRQSLENSKLIINS